MQMWSQDHLLNSTGDDDDCNISNINSFTFNMNFLEMVCVKCRQVSSIGIKFMDFQILNAIPSTMYLMKMAHKSTLYPTFQQIPANMMMANCSGKILVTLCRGSCRQTVNHYEVTRRSCQLYGKNLEQFFCIPFTI